VSIDLGLIFSRFLHYTAALTLCGVSLFPLYAGRFETPHPTEAHILLGTTLIALLSCVAWLLFVTASMTGTLEGTFDLDSLRAVAFGTSFGLLWCARLCLLTVIFLVIACAPDVSTAKTPALALLATLALVMLAGTGHAGIKHLASEEKFR